MSAADFDSLIGWTTAADAAAIERETRRLDLVADYIEAARDQHEHDRHNRWRRVRDGFVAVFVSICGVAMLVVLLVCFGAR